MNGRSWREEWAGNAGVVAVIVVGLFVVVLAVFLYLVPLSRGQDPGLAQSAPAAGATPGAPSIPAAGGESGGMAVLPSPVTDGKAQEHSDTRYGFRLMVPAGWARAQVSDDERPALAADYDVVWEDPDSGARLAVSAWNGENVASFVLWSALVGSGMQSVDGQVPTNAVVAGQPALLLWAPETPVTPARFALFLERDGTYYRVTYSAHDGGAAISDYARALATLRWPDSPDTPLLLPLRAVPDSRYWPSSRLYGGR